jgi:hypothetical protein
LQRAVRPADGAPRPNGLRRGRHAVAEEKDPLIKRETLELVRAYYKIRDGRMRERIFEMVKALGAASHDELLGSRKQRRSFQASP